MLTVLMNRYINGEAPLPESQKGTKRICSTIDAFQLPADTVDYTKTT